MRDEVKRLLSPSHINSIANDLTGYHDNGQHQQWSVDDGSKQFGHQRNGLPNDISGNAALFTFFLIAFLAILLMKLFETSKQRRLRRESESEFPCRECRAHMCRECRSFLTRRGTPHHAGHLTTAVSCVVEEKGVDVDSLSKEEVVKRLYMPDSEDWNQKTGPANVQLDDDNNSSEDVPVPHKGPREKAS